MPASFHAAVSVLAIALAAAPPASAQSTKRIFVPAGYDRIEGASSHTFPWGAAGWANSPYGFRVMLAYDSVYFSGQGWKGRLPIRRLRWRADGGQNSSGGAWNDVVVEMSTAVFDQGSLSRTFDANHGRDRQVVHRGKVVVGPSIGGQPNVSFHVDLVLQKPFLYDPAKGDLLIDVRIAQSWTGQRGARSDAATTIRGRRPQGSMLVNDGSRLAKVAKSYFTNLAQIITVDYSPPGAPADVQPYGTSCGGAGGTPPSLFAVTRPILGARFDVAVRGLTARTAQGFFLLSGSRSQGLDLGAIGAPGCKAWIGLPPALVHGFVPRRSVEGHGYPLPANPSFAGAMVYVQVATLQPRANLLGLLTSNGLAAKVGTH